MSTDHSPWTPPAASVKDAPVEARRRPWSVHFALVLIGLDVALSVAGWLALLRFRHMMQISPSLIFWPLARWTVLIFAGLMIWRGHRWARLLYFAVAVLMFVSKLSQLWWKVLNYAGAQAFIHDPVAMLAFFLEPGLALLAAYLLFFPGRAWFARRP